MVYIRYLNRKGDSVQQLELEEAISLIEEELQKALKMPVYIRLRRLTPNSDLLELSVRT